MCEYWRNYTHNAVPFFWMTYWFLADFSSINSERVTFTYMPYQSNLTSNEFIRIVFPLMKRSIHSICEDVSQRPAYNISRQPILKLISFPTLAEISDPMLAFFLPTLIIPYSTSTWQLHAIGISSLSASVLPLVARWSRNASLYRRTRHEIATWEVTETICKGRSLQIPFLAIAPTTSLPPTTLVASWSMNSRPSLPRRPHLSTCLLYTSPSPRD